MIILNTAFIFLPIFTLFDFCFQKNYGLSFLTTLSDHRLKLFNVYWCVCVLECVFFSCKNYVYYNYNYKFTILGFFSSFLFNRNRFYRILVDRKHSTLLFQLAVFLKPSKFFNLLFFPHNSVLFNIHDYLHLQCDCFFMLSADWKDGYVAL